MIRIVNREKSSKEFLKVGASELLGVYPALRHLVVESLQGSEAMAKHIEALLALMEMCDHCRQAARCRTRVRAMELASKMDEVVPRYLEAFKAAYGDWRDAQKGNIFSVFAVSTATIPRHAIPILLILPTPILFIQVKKEAISLPNPCPVPPRTRWSCRPNGGHLRAVFTALIGFVLL